MDSLLRAEQSYRDHYDRAAAVDQDGWKRARPMPRRHRRASMRVSIAKILIALAMRLTPPGTPPLSMEPAPDISGW